MDVLSRSLAVLALVCAIAAGTVGSTASTARRDDRGGRLFTGLGLGDATGRFRRADRRPRQCAPRHARAEPTRRRLGSPGLGGLEGAPHGEVRLHGTRRSGSARRAERRRADGRVRCHRRLGREHRRRIPDTSIRLQRLVGITRSSCEHREPELRLDGGGCGVERHGPDLLGAHVLVEWERVCLRLRLRPAASSTATSQPCTGPGARSRAAPAAAARPQATGTARRRRSPPRRQRPCRRRIRSASAS